MATAYWNKKLETPTGKGWRAMGFRLGFQSDLLGDTGGSGESGVDTGDATMCACTRELLWSAVVVKGPAGDRAPSHVKLKASAIQLAAGAHGHFQGCSVER
eukprot:3523694-Amphidinium_carterae.1